MIPDFFTLLKSAIFPTHRLTFTYYIPAPPPRGSSYQESHFDKLINEFANRGFKLISSQMCPSTNESGGFWAQVIIQKISLKTPHLKSIVEQIETKLRKSGSEVEGLYQIKE